MIRAPEFWRHNGALAHLLAPLGAVTASITARRVARAGYDCGVPVVCVGNAGVGGAGKTILALHILAQYAARGARPFALTRGHGGSLRGPVSVEPGRHDATAIGDEALLLTASAPTVVARDRAAGARLAVASGATMIVMDDGLQNPGLTRTVSILTVDGGAGFGNGRCLPAGPLREPVAAAAARCACAVLIGPDRAGARALLPRSLPVLTASLHGSCSTALAGERVIGFAGIGRPGKFFATLRDLGAEIVETVGFPDHHVYRPRDLTRLDALARQHHAILATTEKDAVKLPAGFLARCAVVTVDLVFDDPAGLERFLP
ncbi:MAG TPA: tetraacyldisaccharide 4'-kinase [Acidiphilium sp.]